MLVELMAMAHKVDQIDPLSVKNTDEFISALCCALVREDCAIKDIILEVSLDTWHCDMLAHAISNNTSLKSVTNTDPGYGREADLTIDAIRGSPEGTDRVWKVAYGVCPSDRSLWLKHE
jgi:hypothetical protein